MEDPTGCNGNDMLFIRLLYRRDGRVAQRSLGNDADAKDLNFYMVTKRPERIADCLPPFWSELKERIYVCCTMENQRRADERLPIFQRMPIAHREIIVEPMLEKIDFHSSLNGIDRITVGGESGIYARLCHYEWVLDVRRQCKEASIAFHFMQTGGNFYKDGKNYKLTHRLQIVQAARANINIL